MRQISGVLLACTLIAGCAGDNPENVPEYGQWEMETRLVSLTVDGQLIPASAIPPEMQSLNAVDAICGEPMFIDREWQQQDINRKVRGSCTLDSYDVSPSRVRGTGVCRDITPDGEFAPEFELTIAQAEQSYRMNLTMKGMADLPDGSRRFIKATAVQEGRRSGEC